MLDGYELFFKKIAGSSSDIVKTSVIRKVLHWIV